jgi:hypothetical protein
MADTARLIDFTMRRTGDGTPGYKLENAFGQSVQVLPRPPSFRATLSLEWEGAMPDEVADLVERARALGIAVGD